MNEHPFDKNDRAQALMAKANNLDELKTIIKRHKIVLQGGSQPFNAHMLILAIDRFLQDGDARHLTTAGNFRFTVDSLKP
jgi:hypothetical protein